MRNSILLFYLLFSSLVQLQAQTITIEDGFCASGETLSFSGTDGGSPARNIYDGVLYWGPDARITWDDAQSRWELQMIDGGTTDDLYYNTFASYPNPPALGTGTWVDNFGCGPLIRLDGSGTQTSLPVELTDFRGKVSPSGILLSWETASELNNDRFELERSPDGKQFQVIGAVAGNGTSLEAQAYSFTDQNPQNGVCYYRLKQIDLDGQFEYSHLISIQFNGKQGQVGALYPNPSKSGHVHLNYNARKDKQIRIDVFDMTGKLILQQDHLVVRGNNNLSLDFTALHKGIYALKIGDALLPTFRKLIIK